VVNVREHIELLPGIAKRLPNRHVNRLTGAANQRETYTG
jgi:hypothetical protein